MTKNGGWFLKLFVVCFACTSCNNILPCSISSGFNSCNTKPEFAGAWYSRYLGITSCTVGQCVLFQRVPVSDLLILPRNTGFLTK